MTPRDQAGDLASCDTPHGPRPSGFLGHARPNGPRYAPMGASHPKSSFSLTHGSALACGPSPHNRQTEAAKEPHRVCAEAILLLTLGTPGRIAGQSYLHRQARRTPSPPCPQSLKGHGLRRASPGHAAHFCVRPPCDMVGMRSHAMNAKRKASTARRPFQKDGRRLPLDRQPQCETPIMPLGGRGDSRPRLLADSRFSFGRGGNASGASLVWGLGPTSAHDVPRGLPPLRLVRE